MVLRFAVFIDGLWFGGPSAPTDRFAETFEPGLPSHADTDASSDAGPHAPAASGLYAHTQPDSGPAPSAAHTRGSGADPQTHTEAVTHAEPPAESQTAAHAARGRRRAEHRGTFGFG